MIEKEYIPTWFFDEYKDAKYFPWFFIDNLERWEKRSELDLNR